MGYIGRFAIKLIFNSATSCPLSESRSLPSGVHRSFKHQLSIYSAVKFFEVDLDVVAYDSLRHLCSGRSLMVSRHPSLFAMMIHLYTILYHIPNLYVEYIIDFSLV